MTSSRIRQPTEARSYLGQEVTWFDPLRTGTEPRTDVLESITGKCVLLNGKWYALGYIWMEPASTFKDERFPSRWSRIKSFLHSLPSP
jgi:hypothetical protein